MALDGITVANIVFELNLSLASGRIIKVIQPEKDEIMLNLRVGGSVKRLLMSASSSLPIVYLTQKNKNGPMTAPPFCMLLRKHIGGGKILRAWQPSLERVIHIEIEHYDEMGDLRRKDLILELMGKYSNLILCDENSIIIDSIKHVSERLSSVREVLPGKKYFIPQTQKKSDPLNTQLDEFVDKVFSMNIPLSKAIYSAYTGFGPVISEELCYRSSIGSGQNAKEVSLEERLHMFRNFNELIEDVQSEKFEPNIIYDPSHNDRSSHLTPMPVEFAPVCLTMYRDMTSIKFDTMSEVLETYYAQKDRENRIRHKSADLRHIVNTLFERESKKLDLQSRQLEDTKKREQYRISGELLLTYGRYVSKGARSVTVPNYCDADKEIEIELDETMTPSENAQRYFEKYNKLKRTFEALNSLIAQTRAQVRQLESVKTFLDMAQTEEDLSQLRDELIESGYIHEKNTSKGNKSRKKGSSHCPKSGPYHYRTEDGYDIYVGRNNIQNDALTFKLSNSNDWWFHAKKIPGSHVIIKRKGTENIPDSVFEAAASLAAYYSANRTSPKVEVDYVRRKEVRKPAGARPGFVVYYTNYSMTVVPGIHNLTLIE